MFERLVARAMDSVRAIREESQDVGALVNCGFFYIVGTTRNQPAQVISESASRDRKRSSYRTPQSGWARRRSGQPFAVTGIDRTTGLPPGAFPMRQVWRLVDQSGRPAYCFLRERDGRWLVFVRTGDAITLYNRCTSDETAVQRATEIRQLFRRLGWQEQRH